MAYNVSCEANPFGLSAEEVIVSVIVVLSAPCLWKVAFAGSFFQPSKT